MSMNWRGGAVVGQLYIVESEDDMRRVGNCMMSGRLKNGDILLAVRHSGDCFYDYRMVQVYANGIRLENIDVSGYCLGKALKWQPSESELESFTSGEFVRTEEVSKEVADFHDLEAATKLAAVKAATKGQIVRIRHWFGDFLQNFGTVKENSLTETGGELIVSFQAGNGQMEDLAVPFNRLTSVQLAV